MGAEHAASSAMLAIKDTNGFAASYALVDFVVLAVHGAYQVGSGQAFQFDWDWLA